MKFMTRTAIAAMLASLFSFSPIAAENNGLAPEVTDLNAADVSYAKEKLIKYLDKPYISTAPAKLDDGIPVGRLGVDGG
ncbi:MAG: serine hydrolase, partial [Phycisphaerae bacterium]|nr:serine hydrolase [Phycisphaerae bacterium]